VLVEWDVAIEMDDGIVLRADVFRPDDDDRHPVLMGIGPYGKGLHFADGYPDSWAQLRRDYPDAIEGSSTVYAVYESPDPEKWVPHGYVILRVDCRGSGRSPGYLHHFSPRETRDYELCINWAGTRPWSNGKVGLTGISYLSMNQWQVAARQPPHLAAMCPWEGAADWYRDSTHHGGILCNWWGDWSENQVQSVQHGVGQRGPRNRVTGEPVAGPETLPADELAGNRADFGEEILAHPLIDDYYQERTPDWSLITAPLLSCGNWGGQGLHLRGNTDGWARAASPQKWLELHGLEHWTLYYADYGRELQKRFFDFFLKGEDNGWDREPPVQLNIRHVDGSFTLRNEQEWPLARTCWTRLYLDAAERTLSSDAEAAASVSYQGLGDGITFKTPPLERELELTGPAAARLLVSSSTNDADLFLVLRVFRPDGEEVTFQGSLEPHSPVAHGWLRASHRKLDPTLSTDYRPYHTHEEPQPLTPGHLYELDIEIWPTSIVVPPGHTLALTIRGKDHESGKPIELEYQTMSGVGGFVHDDPRDRPADVFDNQVTLHTGGDQPSYLLLPVIPQA
jgi:predicted acyl esterase